MISLFYQAFSWVLALANLRVRSDDFKELEKVVLRHELGILRRGSRQAQRPGLTVSSSRPRAGCCHAGVGSRPSSRRRRCWHGIRRLVTRRWTYSTRPGRPRWTGDSEHWSRGWRERIRAGLSTDPGTGGRRMRPLSSHPCITREFQGRKAIGFAVQDTGDHTGGTSLRLIGHRARRVAASRCGVRTKCSPLASPRSCSRTGSRHSGRPGARRDHRAPGAGMALRGGPRSRRTAGRETGSVGDHDHGAAVVWTARRDGCGPSSVASCGSRRPTGCGQCHAARLPA